MSKVYEALQHAKRAKEATRTPAATPEMRALYRSLDTVFPGLEQKVIMFLGADERAGTSTVVGGLARVVAAERRNATVAILDANTLHPAQPQLFGISAVIGWDDVVNGTTPAANAIYRTHEQGLYVVPVSAAKAGTRQVINTADMASLLGVLRERFDLILIDCAAASRCPDSITLSRHTDGVVLVIAAESTRLAQAKTISEQITKAHGRVIGSVFNKRRYYLPELIAQRP